MIVHLYIYKYHNLPECTSIYIYGSSSSSPCGNGTLAIL